MTLATIVAFAATETEHHNVQLQTSIFGVIALVTFIALGLVVMSYRNVANRHAGKAEVYAATHELPQAGHGHH